MGDVCCVLSDLCSRLCFNVKCVGIAVYGVCTVCSVRVRCGDSVQCESERCCVCGNIGQYMCE